MSNTPRIVSDRSYGLLAPVKLSRFLAVDQRSPERLSFGNTVPKFLVKIGALTARFDDAGRLPDSFIGGKAGNGLKCRVHIFNDPRLVRDHDAIRGLLYCSREQHDQFQRTSPLIIAMEFISSVDEPLRGPLESTLRTEDRGC